MERGQNERKIVYFPEIVRNETETDGWKHSFPELRHRQLKDRQEHRQQDKIHKKYTGRQRETESGMGAEVLEVKSCNLPPPPPPPRRLQRQY